MNLHIMKKIIGAVVCSLCFSAATATMGLAASVAVTEQTIVQNKLSIKYPQISGTNDAKIAKKINEDIKSNVDKFIESCKENEYMKEGTMKYQIHYSDDNKLSLELLKYTYTGGAHGMSYVNGYTYDLHTGQQETLTQAYDFRPSEINQRIFAYAKANDVFLFSDFTGIMAYPDNYYLNEQGNPVILFQQYEIAPYSSGVIRVNML